MPQNNYPEHYKHLQSLAGRLGREIPATMPGYRKLHKGAMKEGALSTQVKEFIAFGIAIAVHCEGCIAYHVHDALRAGASREEVVEAIGVAIMLGDAPRSYTAVRPTRP